MIKYVLKGMIDLSKANSNNSLKPSQRAINRTLFDRRRYISILLSDKYSDRHKFIDKYNNSQSTNHNYEDANYLDFFFESYKTASQELDQLLEIKFPTTNNCGEIIKLYREHSNANVFNQMPLYDNIVAALLKRKYKKSSDDFNALFTSKKGYKYFKIVINNSGDTTMPESFSVFKDNSYILSKDVSAFIKGINKICFCVFKISINKFTNNPENHKYLKLVKKYEPLLFFHYMTARYNDSFNHALSICMYDPSNNQNKKKTTQKAIGMEVFGEYLYNELKNNPICADKAKMPSVAFHQLSKPWKFSDAKVSHSSDNNDIWSKARSTRDKINLYDYCCKLFGITNLISPERVHNDMALILYNSSIRYYCYSYEFYKYKVEHNIISSPEIKVLMRKKLYNSIWTSTCYMPFEYFPYQSTFDDDDDIGEQLNKTSERIRELIASIYLYKQLNSYKELKQFWSFARNASKFIEEKSQKPYIASTWENSYNICIDIINAMSREKIFNHLLNEHVTKPNKLCPSTTDFEQAPPDSSKESPL